MKLAWIICVLIITFDAIQMKSTDNSDEETESSPEESSPPAKIKINTNRPSVKPQVPAPSKSNIKNRQMPKVQRKEPQRGPSFVLTTRRPLMKTRKFTTKPHAVYHVPSNEQHNYSRRRQLNSKKRFRHQNEKSNSQIKISSSENADDRFKNFKDSDELDQNKNNVPSRRVHSLTPAASEKFTVRTLPNKNDTIDNIFRSKAKLAIEESLRKFKGIRPEPKDKAVITNRAPPSVNRRKNTVVLQDVKENKSNLHDVSNKSLQSTTDATVTSTIKAEKLDQSESKLIKTVINTELSKEPITTTTPKLDHFVTKSEESVFAPTTTTTDKSISDHFVTKLEKSFFDPTTTTTDTPKLDYFGTKSGKPVFDATTTTTDKLKLDYFGTKSGNSVFDATTTTTDTPKLDYFGAKSGKPVFDATTTTTDTPKLDYFGTKSGKSVFDATTSTTDTPKLDYFGTKSGKSDFDSTTTTTNTPKLNYSGTKSGKAVLDATTSTTDTPNSDYFGTKSEKSVFDASTNTTEKSDIPAAETIEVVTDNKLVSLEETAESKPITKEKITVSTEISRTTSVDDLMAIDIQQLITRRKRASNIIEEEQVATTSNGFKANGREALVNVDFSYKNINI